MTTIADLAAEFNAQPYEVAAFADLGRDYSDHGELTPETEQMIREAWNYVPEIVTTIETVAEGTRTTVESWGVAHGRQVALFADGRLQAGSEHGVIVLAQPGSVDQTIIDRLAALHRRMAETTAL